MIRRTSGHLRIATWLCCLTAVGLTGCGRPVWHGRSPTASAPTFHHPVRIEILPFTRACSFDADPIPDGVEVVLRPVDAMGDATQVQGRYHVELCEFRRGSLRRRGERLQFWQVDVDSVFDQKQWWDSLTRSYQFQLAWDRPLQPNRKYLLAVTYIPADPGQDRLFAETVVAFEVSDELLRSIKQSQAKP